MPKQEDKQAQALLFRGRERLVRQRTELVTALRSVLYEFGHPIPPVIGHLKRIGAMIEAENSDLNRTGFAGDPTSHEVGSPANQVRFRSTSPRCAMKF